MHPTTRGGRRSPGRWSALARLTRRDAHRCRPGSLRPTEAPTLGIELTQPQASAAVGWEASEQEPAIGPPPGRETFSGAEGFAWPATRIGEEETDRSGRA